MIRFRLYSIATICIVFGFTGAYGQIITVPTDLESGDEYRLVFITKNKIFTAESSDIADYDAHVTSQANMSPSLAELQTNWRVIGSTPAVSAKVHTDTDDSPLGATGVPVYRLDGMRIADNYDDLWDGNIHRPLFIAQDGSTLNTCCGTWTGTRFDGLAAVGYELGSGLSVVDGAPNGIGDNWVQTSPYSAAELQYLYGISDVLIVPGAELEVGIDIKPGTDTACGGVIPVAVHGSEAFDVTQIDPGTLNFQGLSVRSRGNDSLSCSVKDANSDGYVDLVCQYQNDSAEGVITGRLLDGTPIEGSDIFCIAH